MSNTMKFVRIGLVVLAVVVLVTACAPAPTPVPPTSAPTAVPPTATLAKPVDIELWSTPTSMQAPAPPDDWVGYKIIREKLNINLKYVAYPSAPDNETKLNAAAAANNLPDFFDVVGAAGSRNKLIDLYKQGLIAPVGDLMPLMPIRVKTHYNQDPAAQDLVKWDGKQWGFVEVANLPKRLGLVIRKDWLDKLGLKAPTTIDELFTVAKAFTEKDPDGNGKNDTYGLGGFVAGGWGEDSQFAFFWGAYGCPDVWDWSNVNDKFGLCVRTPGFYKALVEFRKWNEAKVIDADWPTIKRDDFRNKWYQGKFGIMWEDFGALAMKSNYPKFDQNFPNGEWIPLPPPKGPDGTAIYSNYGGIGNIFAISKKAADAGKGPAIAKLLEWMATDEGYYLLGFGVKGVNYNLDKDGAVTTDGLPDPKLAWDAEGTQSLTQMRNQLIFTNDPKEVKARYPDHKSINGRTISPMSFYQFFSTQKWLDSKPGNIIPKASNQADLLRYYNENFQAFALGTKPLNDQTWADFLKAVDTNVKANEWEATAKKTLQDAGYIKK